MSLAKIYRHLWDIGVNLTKANAFQFDWKADYSMGEDETPSKYPFYWIEPIGEDGEIENLDNQIGGGGAQSSEFYNIAPMYVFSQVPAGALDTTEVSVAEYNHNIEYLQYLAGIEGVEDIVRLYDINGRYIGKDVCATIGLRDIQYIRTIPIPLEKNTQNNNKRYRSEFEIKYRTARLR